MSDVINSLFHFVETPGIYILIIENVIFVVCFNLSIILSWMQWWPMKFCSVNLVMNYKIISELTHIRTYIFICIYIYICCCFFSLSDSCGGCGHKWSRAFAMPFMSPHICKQSQPVGTCEEWTWRWSRTIQLFCVWPYSQE